MVNSIIAKIEKLENELLKLKKGSKFAFPKKTISLKGIIKKTEITEKDIEEAKKSLFNFKEIKI